MKKGTVIFLLILLPLSIALVFCGKSDNNKNKKVGGEYEGEWKNATTNITIDNNRDGTYKFESNNGSGATESASGKATTSDDFLFIDKKKFKINAAPTVFLVRPGFLAAYMVLDNDSLFKQISDPNHCTNGQKDQGESGVDCGGECTPCPTCHDSILNQNETDIDCGGVCSACNCEDGRKNQNETGVDCGGPCEPCSTNACNLQVGEATNGYLANGIISNISGTGYLYTSSGEVSLEFYFPSQAIKAYEIFFYERNFTTIPIGLTELYKVDYNSDNEINKCTVEFNLGTQTLEAEEGSKVYVTRLGEKSFNLKFCNLKRIVTVSSSINTTFSINANFTIN